MAYAELSLFILYAQDEQRHNAHVLNVYSKA